jgi:opacity protein-like surface antigen
MRRAITLATVLLVVVPAAARAQVGNSSVQGFGGLTFGTSSFLPKTETAPLGGVVAIGISPNIQAIGEIGRMSNIEPSLYDVLEFTPVEFNLSAWYWEGGVRFIASPHMAVRPYAQATAGIARMHASLSGLGDRFDPFVNAALQFMNTNEPVLGAGVGVLLERGPLSVDIGYRYKKINAGGIPSYINAGDAYQINEARVGIGVRF